MAHSSFRALLRVPTLIALTFCAMLGTASAQAQPGRGGDAVAVRAVVRSATIKPGEPAVIAVESTHASGFHTWPAKAVELPAAIDKFAERTAVELTEAAPKGVRIAARQWPEPHPGKVPDFEKGGTTTVPLYSGRAVTYLTVVLPGDAKGAVSIPITVHYQACNEVTCQEPQDPELTVSVIVSPDAPASTGKDEAIFAGYKPVDAATLAAAFQPQPSTSGVAAAPSIFGISAGGGLLILFLLAAIGGAALNLTPCVLPVIPIKIMTLVHHAGKPAKRVMLGLWMAFGIVAFWFVVGLPMIILRASDPSQFIFGVWWITLSIGILIAAMGLGIMGLFLFQLPQSVYLINPKADTPWGSFLFGVMTAVLGLPCFGFVAGGLLAGAAALPRTSIAAVFLGLGVGMAVPYLILSIWPALINRIPRTGPASDLVKQVMGLLLIAAAAWFIAAGINGLLLDMPYLNHSLTLWIVSFFVFLAGAWAALRTIKLAKSLPIKAVVSLVAIAGVGATIAFAAMSTRADREDWERAQAGGGNDASIVPGTWLLYNPGRMKAALASGKVVVADFTAEWCINCKALKRTILDRDPVRARIQQGDVILIEVDCTSKKSLGSAYLKELGQTGVPALAIFGPVVDPKKPLIYNSYLPATVIAAIETAKGNGAPKVRVAEGAPNSLH